MAELEPHNAMTNDMMIRYIEKVRREPDKYVLNRGTWDRFFNTAPTDIINPQGDAGSSVLYKDNHGSWTSTTFMGLEFDFLMLDVCLISFAYRAIPADSRVRNPMLMGVLMAYLTSQFLTWMR
jgi:hypothetical protein